MISEQITIINKLGLHARAATKLASTCGAFGSQIRIGHNGKMVDGKSVMALMLLAAAKDTRLNVECNGKDEELALNAIRTLINDFFGEGQ